jgi:hypothetical protein
MQTMGPEAALLSARLAEIRAIAGQERPIYVEAAVRAGRPQRLEIVLAAKPPGLWGRLRSRMAGRPTPRPDGIGSRVPGAAIPALRKTAGSAGSVESATSLALLPACQEARH